MSLSRSPSPRRGGGGWASPGLTPGYDDGGGESSAGGAAANGRRPAAPGMWAPRARGATTGAGDSGSGFVRHFRNLSGQLPYFRAAARDYSNKEKLGRGRWSGSAARPDWRQGNRILPFVGRVAWRLRVPLVLLLALFFFLVVSSRKYPRCG
jgi:mannan polymerase II complex MNN10 subunit